GAPVEFVLGRLKGLLAELQSFTYLLQVVDEAHKLVVESPAPLSNLQCVLLLVGEAPDMSNSAQCSQQRGGSDEHYIAFQGFAEQRRFVSDGGEGGRLDRDEHK